jgi:hypothetical protein
MLTQPTAEYLLMSTGINGVDDSTGIGNFAGINLYIWNSLSP